MRVSDMLLEGKESAITGSRLVDALELKDLREFTQLIEGERRARAAVVTDTTSQKARRSWRTTWAALTAVSAMSAGHGSTWRPPCSG